MRSVRVQPGRSLVISPEWGVDEPSVLFDRNSGDYWVVPSTVRRWVQLLLVSTTPIEITALRRNTPELDETEFDSALKQLFTVDIFQSTEA